MDYLHGSPKATLLGSDNDLKYKQFTRRRQVMEYRIWSQGLLGSAKLILQVSATVWAEIYPQVLCMVLLSLGVTSIHQYLHEFHVSLEGHKLLLVPVSFLLVFRCSNSYARYWEGRSLLGLLVFHSREIYSKSCCYSPSGDGDADQFCRNMLRYLICTILLLNRTVQKHWEKVEHDRARRLGEVADRPWKWDWRELQDHLNQDEYEVINKCESSFPLIPMLWMRQEIATAVSRGLISEFQFYLIDGDIAALQQVWNGMSKITTTPLPFPWMHLARLILW
eukprot:Sspe_Gene.103912::Locus_79771_Transcript_1_1_Confidence_1.000_Length_930::g.103912::m.103912/K08994/yneE; putative membrane protein